MQFHVEHSGRVRSIEFEEFSEIVSGRSIVAISGSPPYSYNNTLTLELSGGVKADVFFDERELIVHLSPYTASTYANPASPLLISLGDMPRMVSLRDVQLKLDGLRTLHALYFLVYSGRARELENLLRRNPDTDIESALLSEEERLHVESISSGSWNLALWARKFKESVWALGSVVGLVYDRGRDAFLRKLEADAWLKEEQAKRQAIENEIEMVKLRSARVDYIHKVTKEIGDRETKRIVQKRLVQAAQELVTGDRFDSRAAKEMEDDLNI